MLVPNERGLDRALELGCRHIAIFGSATETFAQRNLNRSLDEQFAMFEPTVTRARDAGLDVRAYVSMCFGDPWEGEVPIDQVVRSASASSTSAPASSPSATPSASARPATSRDLLTAFNDAGLPNEALAVHFHDTYGQALANALAALQHGITTFDASAGGLGGCPYAESATGNLATEDLVWMLHGLGIETGVDLGALVRHQPLDGRRARPTEPLARGHGADTRHNACMSRPRSHPLVPRLMSDALLRAGGLVLGRASPRRAARPPGTGSATRPDRQPGPASGRSPTACTSSWYAGSTWPPAGSPTRAWSTRCSRPSPPDAAGSTSRFPGPTRRPGSASPRWIRPRCRPQELVRLAVGVLARLLPGVPLPPAAPTRPRWPLPWRRRFRLHGSPGTVAAVRQALLAQGLVESDWRPTHVVIARPIEVMMAEHWAASVQAGGILRWSTLWRRTQAAGRLPRPDRRGRHRRTAPRPGRSACAGTARRRRTGRPTTPSLSPPGCSAPGRRGPGSRVTPPRATCSGG